MLVGSLIIAMEMIGISHAVGVSSKNMEKPGEEHRNGCLEQRSTSITYSGCSDLVCGYD